MRAELEIRPARLSDVDAVHRLETAAFPVPWRREFFESEVRGSGRFNIVAERAGELVGYVFSTWILEEMHVNKIAVVPEERRAGVATLLMDRCFVFARKNGIHTIWLEVRQSNQGAIDFYTRLKFTSKYIRPGYYPDGEAAVVMTAPV